LIQYVYWPRSDFIASAVICNPGKVHVFIIVHSLSEYSDENMMDPYNLAICFGPTLIPIPPDRDQVTFQTNVNEVIKTIIRNQDEIFTTDGGEMYEKCIVDMG